MRTWLRPMEKCVWWDVSEVPAVGRRRRRELWDLWHVSRAYLVSFRQMKYFITKARWKVLVECHQDWLCVSTCTHTTCAHVPECIGKHTHLQIAQTPDYNCETLIVLEPKGKIYFFSNKTLFLSCSSKSLSWSNIEHFLFISVLTFSLFTIPIGKKINHRA